VGLKLRQGGFRRVRPVGIGKIVAARPDQASGLVRAVVKRQQKTAKRKKWGSSKKPPVTSRATKAKVVAMYLTNVKRAAIARELGLDRETVPRILSQPETELLVQAYRDAVLKIVPNALIGASELVKTRGRQVKTQQNTAKRKQERQVKPQQTSASKRKRSPRNKWGAPHKKRGQAAHYRSEKSAKVSQTEA
jgi:hypothetical protein